MGFRKRHSSYFRNCIYRCEIYICLSVQTIDEEGHSESGIDAPRVKALLKASFILRSTSPVAVLPAYLLNEELVRQSCTFLCPSLFLQIAIFEKILLAPSVIWSTHFFFSFVLKQIAGVRTILDFTTSKLLCTVLADPQCRYN